MMNKQEVYIDWSKAPEGTTHAFVTNGNNWCNGVPKSNNLWEKHGDLTVYEWSRCGWLPIGTTGMLIQNNRIKKPEEKVMNTNSLEQNIERMEKELADMKAKLKAGEKWEPKGGDWTVDWRGRVVRSTGAKDNNVFGIMFQTQEQAEIASRLMRERNRIIQYVLEHVPYWKFEFFVGVNNYFVYYNSKISKWDFSSTEYTQSQDVLMPKWVAEKLVDDLNSGRVKL